MREADESGHCEIRYFVVLSDCRGPRVWPTIIGGVKNGFRLLRMKSRYGGMERVVPGGSSE